jgi:RHS repeat-associated protein
MTYDAASQLKGINRYADLDGTQLVADSSYDYDVASRLKELKHFKGTDVLAAYGFDYDAGNRITSFTSPDGTSTYSYDLTNQLTGTDHSYQDDENYSYDANGNRTNDGYDTGTDNRLLTDGKYNYSYDDEGNRTQRVEIATGEVTEYSWDYRNRLTQVVVKDADGNVIKTAGYTYDMFDRRIAKEVDPDGDGVATAEIERFVYDGEHIALTFDGDGMQTHRYLHGSMIDQVLASENAEGEVLWALTDNQGTVRDVVDNSGTVVNHITYDSFGQITSETNPNVDFRFGYTGREFDEETGQYYYRARYYDAAVGQFINQDPIGFAGGDSNLHRYVFNSPTNFNDPSGEAVVLAIPLAIKGAAILAAGAAYILSNPQAREVAQELPRRLPKPSFPSLPPFTPPLSDDLSPNRFPTQPKDDSKSEPNKIDGTPTDGECNPQPQPPDCKPIDPVEKITEEFLEQLIEEALEFQGKLGEQESGRRTVAVAQARDKLTGKREIVVTTSNGAFTQAQNDLAEAKGYETVKTADGLGRTGWHAEGRVIQWSFIKNKEIEGMGVSRKLCPDCAKDVDSNKIKTQNLRYGDDYFTKDKRRKPPKKRPKKPEEDNDC